MGIISDDFTFENVRKFTKAIAVYLFNHDLTGKPFIFGHDARFLAEKFTDSVVKIMEEAGLHCLLVERDTPAPVVAWEIKDREASGAIMVGAANHPAEYCGIKFLLGDGQPLTEEHVKEIKHYIFMEESTSRFMTNSPDPDLLAFQKALSRMGKTLKAKSKLERFEPRQRYLKHLAGQIDTAAIKKARLKIVVDPMYGSGRGYLDTFLQELGCQVEEIHDHRDVLFGGRSPDPLAENLAELKSRVAATQADLGLALSGDAGAFAVIDRAGKYFSRPAADGILECVKQVEQCARQ